jgi:hypothetical protein
VVDGFRSSALTALCCAKPKKVDGSDPELTKRKGGLVMPVTKSFPVSDCDAHINDPTQIWDYVPDSKKELVKNTYWRHDSGALLNGTLKVLGGAKAEFPGYNPIWIAGPQMNKKIMRENADKVADTTAAEEGSAIGVGGLRVPSQGASY